jgi:hypothetical protein
MTAEDDQLKTSSQQSENNHNTFKTKQNNRGAYVMRSMGVHEGDAIASDDKFFAVLFMKKDGDQEQDDD